MKKASLIIGALPSAQENAVFCNGGISKGSEVLPEIHQVSPTSDIWPFPVNGEELLCEVGLWQCFHLAISAAAENVITLWVVMAHAFEAFAHAPRLYLSAPVSECGRTTALDLIADLVPHPVRAQKIDAPGVLSCFENGKPTLLLDDVHKYLPKDEDLKFLLEAGYSRGIQAG